MNSLITTHQTELTNLCKDYHVRRLELFGSAAKDSSELPIRDIDFLVDFANLERVGYADTYFGLLESLQNLFNKPVDLIMLSAVKNPYLLQSIEKDRKTIYAA